jgi:hypothetical protein
VKLLSHDLISCQLGARAQLLDVKALAHLQRLAGFKYFGKGFHPSENGKVLGKLAVNDWFSTNVAFNMLKRAVIDPDCSFNVFPLEIINKIIQEMLRARKF